MQDRPIITSSIQDATQRLQNILNEYKNNPQNFKQSSTPLQELSNTIIALEKALNENHNIAENILKQALKTLIIGKMVQLHIERPNEIVSVEFQDEKLTLKKNYIAPTQNIRSPTEKWTAQLEQAQHQFNGVAPNNNNHYKITIFKTIKNWNDNRPLSKLATEDKMPGDLGAQNRSVLDIHEDSSTKSTQQITSEVEFRKRSNTSPLQEAKNELSNYIKELQRQQTQQKQTDSASSSQTAQQQQHPQQHQQPQPQPQHQQPQPQPQQQQQQQQTDTAINSTNTNKQTSNAAPLTASNIQLVETTIESSNKTPPPLPPRSTPQTIQSSVPGTMPIKDNNAITKEEDEQEKEKEEKKKQNALNSRNAMLLGLFILLLLLLIVAPALGVAALSLTAPLTAATIMAGFAAILKLSSTMRSAVSVGLTVLGCKTAQLVTASVGIACTACSAAITAIPYIIAGPGKLCDNMFKDKQRNNRSFIDTLKNTMFSLPDRKDRGFMDYVLWGASRAISPLTCIFFAILRPMVGWYRTVAPVINPVCKDTWEATKTIGGTTKNFVMKIQEYEKELLNASKPLKSEQPKNPPPPTTTPPTQPTPAANATSNINSVIPEKQNTITGNNATKNRATSFDRNAIPLDKTPLPSKPPTPPTTTPFKTTNTTNHSK